MSNYLIKKNFDEIRKNGKNILILFINKEVITYKIFYYCQSFYRDEDIEF